MEIEDLLFKKYAGAFGWAVLGVIFLLLDFMVVGVNQWQFMYGIVYAITFFAVALLFAVKNPSYASGILVAAMGAFVVFMSPGYLPSYLALIATSVLMVMVLVTQFALKTKSDAKVKYLLLVPFFMLILYFVHGLIINLTTPLGLESTMLWAGTRLGIMLLAADGILRVLGKKYKYLMPIALLIAVLGALYLTVGVGAGLSLIN